MKMKLFIVCIWLSLFCGCGQQSKYQMAGAGLGGAAAYFGANTENDSHRQAAGAVGVYAGVELANKLFNDNKDAHDDGYKKGYIKGYKEATAKQLRQEWETMTAYKVYGNQGSNVSYSVIPAGKYDGINYENRKVYN